MWIWDEEGCYTTEAASGGVFGLSCKNNGKCFNVVVFSIVFLIGFKNMFFY
jgi:hypothetical protein